MKEPYLEELGMLRVLEHIEEGLVQLGPTVRHCLIERGLVSLDDPLRLTGQGQRLLRQLRAESLGESS